MFLDLIGAVVLTAVAALDVEELTSGLASRPALRRAVVAIAGGWIGLAVWLAATGIVANASTRVSPIGLMVVGPLLVVAIAAAFLPAARDALHRIPLSLLIGLNSARVLGAFFLLLAAADRLGGPFPQSAGWGDLIVGALAAPLAVAVARGRASSGLIRAWNILGTLDLLAALTLGLLSFNGSPLQLIHAGVGAQAILDLPWSLIPTVLVPMYLLTHALIFVRLGRSSAPVPAAV